MKISRTIFFVRQQYIARFLHVASSVYSISCDSSKTSSWTSSDHRLSLFLKHTAWESSSSLIYPVVLCLSSWTVRSFRPVPLFNSLLERFDAISYLLSLTSPRSMVYQKRDVWPTRNDLMNDAQFRLPLAFPSASGSVGSLRSMKRF